MCKARSRFVLGLGHENPDFDTTPAQNEEKTMTYGSTVSPERQKNIGIEKYMNTDNESYTISSLEASPVSKCVKQHAAITN